MGLGATRWEMIRQVAIPQVGSGLVAGSMLAFGRAAGEAIAVTQVIGGALGWHWSLFASSNTLASMIAATFNGTPTSLGKASLFYLALILLAIEPDHQPRGAAHRGPHEQEAGGAGMSAIAENPFQPTRRSKRRKRVGQFMELLGTLASVLAVVMLIIVIASVIKRSTRRSAGRSSPRSRRPTSIWPRHSRVASPPPSSAR